MPLCKKGFLPEFSICIFKSSSVANGQQERERSYKGKKEREGERERGFNPEFSDEATKGREEPNQGLARPSPHLFPLLPRRSRVQCVEDGVPDVRF